MQASYTYTCIYINIYIYTHTHTHIRAGDAAAPGWGEIPRGLCARPCARQPARPAATLGASSAPFCRPAHTLVFTPGAFSAGAHRQEEPRCGHRQPYPHALRMRVGRIALTPTCLPARLRLCLHADYRCGEMDRLRSWRRAGKHVGVGLEGVRCSSRATQSAIDRLGNFARSRELAIMPAATLSLSYPRLPGVI